MKKQSRYLVAVSVEPEYVPEQSIPSAGRFLFAYRVTITNTGELPAKLLSRHWYIADSNGLTREVAGEGVVGEQPYLLPGQEYQYTSGSLMETPYGSMSGYFDMLADDGQIFKAEIPEFHLTAPRLLH